MQNELISIVITTHKRSDKIENAIKSALNQTYKNIEVIVVDDNSELPKERFKTEEITKKYNNVKLIKNEKNLGGAVSRNVGIKASKGKLISFLDDDDQYLPTRLEILYNIINSHRNDNIGLAYCSCSTIDDDGNVTGEYVNVYNGQPFYNHMYNCVAGTSMWLASKKALLSVGGFDDVPCKQDSTVILKLLVAEYTIFGTPEKLVLYFEHHGNGISGTKISNLEGIKKYRDKCRKQYFRLNQKEISNIECHFSEQLITISIINNKNKIAKKELANVKKYKPASKIYFKNLLKILFPKTYLRKIQKRKS